MKDFSIFASTCKLAKEIRNNFLYKENEIPYCVAGGSGISFRDWRQEIAPWTWIQKTTKAPKKQLFLMLQSAAHDLLSYVFLISVNGTGKRNFSEYPNRGVFLFGWFFKVLQSAWITKTFPKIFETMGWNPGIFLSITLKLHISILFFSILVGINKCVKFDHSVNWCFLVSMPVRT